MAVTYGLWKSAVSAPLANADTLYCGLSHALVALNRADGTYRWHAQPSKGRDEQSYPPIYSAINSPLLSVATTVVNEHATSAGDPFQTTGSDNAYTLSVYDHDGQRVWESSNAETHLLGAHQDIVYIQQGYSYSTGDLLAIACRTGETLWHSQ